MSKFRLVAPLMIIMLVLTACPAGDSGGSAGTGGSPDASGATGSGEGIIVTSLWGGEEQRAFEAVLAAFTEETGIPATYESNRTEYDTVLRTRIQGGNPPDIAIMPGVGILRSFVADGAIVPFTDLGINREDIEGNYAPGVLDISTIDGELYGVMVKSNSKSYIWYSPARFEEMGVEPATSWEELLQLTEDIKAAGKVPWALGAGPDADWTLTDWFENIYLRQAGPDAYDTLFSPEGDWTDQSVKDAIETMKLILNDDNVDGGIDGALSIGFVDGIAKVFSTSPSAELFYEGGFVGGIAVSEDVNPDLVIGTDIDSFDFPPIDGQGEGSVTLGGDFVTALTNRDETKQFVQFMTEAASGEIWATEGTIISPLNTVDTSVYPDELVIKEADQIANATAVRFDGSDILPAGPSLGLDVMQGAMRGDDLDALLEEFQQAVTTAWEEEGS